MKNSFNYSGFCKGISAFTRKKSSRNEDKNNKKNEQDHRCPPYLVQLKRSKALEKSN